MQRELKRLRTWLGRVIRDVQRKGGEIAGALKDKLQIAQRLYEQRRDSKHKLYALHAPEMECLAKGKARTSYEFGLKVSVAATAKEGLVVDMRSMPGNPYDVTRWTANSNRWAPSAATDRRSRWPTAATAGSSRRPARGC
jgi:IS5 family transposase